MKYAVVTFGCRVNQADSLGFEEGLLENGATATSPDRADVVIVNTCSVTATADQGARQAIRRVARDNPAARIVVTGCYATRRPDDIGALPNVSCVVPNDEKPQLIQLIVRDFDDGRVSSAERFGDGDGACGAVIEPGVAGRTAFTLRVQTGCAESCSYCIIPTTRGMPRSVPVADVIAETERVVRAGFKEIALTGVHLGSYGRDLSLSSSLPSLLDALDQFWEQRSATSDVVFRISSLEPMDCVPEIVRLVAESPRFAPHFHLPLQHASDRMLAAMHRPYTSQEYWSLVQDIREQLPHASIGTDIIVGFPGETDEDHDRLAAFLEQSPLTHVHVFPYSDRPGTVASRLTNKVPGGTIRARAQRIRAIGADLATRFRLMQVGTTHRGLTIEDGSRVVTDNYLKVSIPPGLPRNEWVQVRIVKPEVGELVNS
jgi:threonylcarbamoyladenosine tRNA methylthiotransferase MtaB